MDLGLNIAASGMLAEQVQEDQLANDLANASTPGFKPTVSDQNSFGQLLFANSASGQTIGGIYQGVQVGKTGLDLQQGSLESTGEPLDFAISGTGFFAVKTASGTEYTRNGQFSTNAQGLLVDQSGDEVLSQNGSPIKVGSATTVPASAVGVFALNNPTEMGNSNFTGTAAGRGAGTVLQGQLESSGVDAIQTMVAMTSALEAYQAGQQTIQTINQTMQESASTVGLVQGG
jgi:flagellar basal-body rod protein FlgF